MKKIIKFVCSTLQTHFSEHGDVDVEETGNNSPNDGQENVTSMARLQVF